jgi:hypothetical protein
MGSSTGPACQPAKIGESLVSRADLSLLETWVAPRWLTSEPVHHALRYARPFRYAKEFGPDQVLKSGKGDNSRALSATIRNLGTVREYQKKAETPREISGKETL